MIEGSDKLDASSCDTVKAAADLGLRRREARSTLVRNPNYDPKTDTPKARENFPDEFTFTVNSNVDDIYAEDRAAATSRTRSPRSRRRSCASTTGSPQLKTNDGDRTWYLTMNLTQPPFDDIHVRQAMNWVIDSDALRKAWGGPSAGAIATHIVPDAILDDKLKGYAPYGSTASGDVAKAKAEMKLSKYDTNHDGICDAKACKNVFTITGDRAGRDGDASRSLEQNLQVDRHHVQGCACSRTPTRRSRRRARTSRSRRSPGWGKDYADAVRRSSARSSTAAPSSRRATRTTRSSASRRRWPRRSASRATSPASRASTPTSTSARRSSATPRVSCYEALDKKLTTKIVPWVPYLWALRTTSSSKNVTKWDFDQFGADDRLRPRGGQVI